MVGLFINLIYLCLLLVASPVLLWKRVSQGKYVEGWGQKLWGHLPTRGDDSKKLVWFHAVSVGEVLQLQQVIDQFREAVPEVDVLISTTTQTGHAVALEKFPDAQVTYFPMDFTWSVRKALKRVKPDLIVLVELELWPNFIRVADSFGIPLVIINGRLSENSYRGYLKIHWLIAGLLKRFETIAVQSNDYRERFIALGCPTAKVITTGSIKFDGVRTNRNNPQTATLREWLEVKADEQVLIAGSTQDPEEEMVLSIYTRLLAKFPKLRLVLVPRHPERGDAIASLIVKLGYPLIRRSTHQKLPGLGAELSVRQSTSLPAIGLLDTVGELGACWGLADVAFVGGSFGNRGGQNMLEPAAYGAAVCFGSNTKNFRHIVELLLAADGAKRVNSAAELEQFIREMLINHESATALGQRAKELILQHQGATERTIQILKQTLNS